MDSVGDPHTQSHPVSRVALSAGGLPHSDIAGSTRVCRSPTLFAACHVLHRLPVPRHPSCALSSLTTEILYTPAQGSAPKRVAPLEPCSTCGEKMPQSCARNPQGFPAPELPGAPAAQLSKITATANRGDRPQNCMGVLGVEPRTSSLSGTRSNQTELYARGRSRPHRSAHSGGAEGIRTLDIQLAKLALSPTELQPRPANIRPLGASGPSGACLPGGPRPLNSTTCHEPHALSTSRPPTPWSSPAPRPEGRSLDTP